MIPVTVSGTSIIVLRTATSMWASAPVSRSGAQQRPGWDRVTLRLNRHPAAGPAPIRGLATAHQGVA